MKRLVLFVVMLLWMPVFSCFGDSEPISELTKTRAASKPTTNPRMAALSALQPVQGGTVVLGDSITASQDLSDLLETPIHNRAVSGITTGGVLNNFDIIFRGTPDKVFILLGINDIIQSVGKKQFVGNYRTITDKIKTVSPGSRVYAMSILPTNNTKYNASVLIMNDLLKYFAPKMNAVYIDLNSRFLSGTAIDPEYAVDGIHLNARGYTVLKDVLTPYLLGKQVQ